MNAITENNTRLHPIPWAELSAQAAPRYLVKHLLDEGAASVVYGPPNCGKTFLCLDLGLAVARGIAWREKRVNGGAVVYLAAEAGHGIRKRLDAYATHHGIDPSEVPFFVIPSAVNLTDTDDQNALVRAVKESQSPEPALIIIDTLARTLGDQDENSAQGMGLFVRAVDRLREETGAHVMIVHHSGKDTTRGARGSTALLGAVDTEIAVEKSDAGEMFARVTKQRDGEVGAEMPFNLAVIELGIDQDGDPIASCAVEHSFAEVQKGRRALTGANRIAFETLRKVIDERGEELAGSSDIPLGIKAVAMEHWRHGCYFASISTADGTEAKRKAFTRASAKLRGMGRIGIANDFVWIIPE